MTVRFSVEDRRTRLSTKGLHRWIESWPKILGKVGRFLASG